jgi:predicted enzyme related to lactoylglutathione lyase
MWRRLGGSAAEWQSAGALGRRGGYRRAVNWVDCMIDVPAPVADVATSFWAAALGWKVGETWGDHPEFTSLEPADGESFVHVQVIDAPPRIHLDFAVPDIDDERDRLATLGATAGSRTPHWQVMSSPGGFPFCLTTGSRQRAVPGPVRWPDGHSTRLVQVCIDSPDRLHEQERRFWLTATGWGLAPSDRPEFGGRSYPPSGPIRLLYQRLGTDDPGESVRAHLDLATDDIPAEVARLVTLGANRIGSGSGWYALRDPAGLAFCVTGQSPY